MSRQEPVWPSGLRVFQPHEKAPDFVKAEIVINCQEFEQFMKARHVMGTLKLTMKQGRSGALYCQLNTFVPQSQGYQHPEYRESPVTAQNRPTPPAPRKAPPPPPPFTQPPQNDEIPGLEPGDGPTEFTPF
jgi:hypothetical protein